MANHYQTIIVPTRVARRRTKLLLKPLSILQHIIARMRNYCASIDEYNQYLLKLLDEFNEAFSEEEGSRLQMFKFGQALKELPTYV